MLLIEANEAEGQPSFEDRRISMTRLEEAANSVEYGLPRLLHTSDRATQAWLTDEVREIATGLRRLKRLIVLSDKESLQQLIGKVSTSLLYAARGEWTKLDHVEEEPITTPQRRARILSIIRRVVIGALPLSILVAIQQSSMKIEGDLADYLKAVTILWAAVSYLNLLDPQSTEKADTVKSLAEILPFGGAK
jgi:hypothetical protein